ncbi:universal stress protein [Planctobacterium marinum]|uniref:universal stress protein n=1 Tax=Planctobacterium marinum TaxID=1631968 RepID=UPI001E611918|nr:universal stress protein [Planctobacterium marinum]MCC2607497.1 universal stress protein [Planctobacterium marinum]
MEQTPSSLTANIIWLVDGKHTIHPAVEDKVVKLAKLHHATISIVFDNRLRARERHYWFMFDKSEQAEQTWIKEQEEKQQRIRERMKQENLAFNFIVLDKPNYMETIEACTQGKKDNLLLIQDEQITERHPIFQDLANLQCHVLVMQPKAWNSQTRLIGAVDPLHENSRPDDLDFIISKKTRNLAKLLKSEWVIAHACHVPASFIQYKHKISTLHRQGLDDFMERIGATPKHAVLLNGLPEKALTDWVNKQDSDILVIGNVTRNMLLSHLVGSTTMALLNNPPCDMLLIKSPRHN